MNYKVLYRKYRPNSFDALIGQNAIVEILKNSIRDEKIAHAYIFSGPRGTGKTSTARILAKAVNCLNPLDGLACGECKNCQDFNSSPDIIEIDAASNNGVDEIRELINNVKIMPTTLKYKVYIIDEVHMLTTSAFNALLLTLEEPPSHVIFILATTNLEKVPITILSRCQKFDFKRINQKDVLKQLVYVCQEEKIEYEDQALEEISALSDGGMRDALSILDQLSKSTNKITLESVIKDVGSISNERISELINAVDENNIDKVLKILEEFQSSSLNYKVVIKKMMDKLAYKAVKVLKNGPINHLEYDDYKKIIIDLNDMINRINISVDPYLIIEIILLGYIKPTNKVHSLNEPTAEESDETKVEVIPANTDKDERENSKKDLETSVLAKIRINNCFAKASKEELNKIKMEWSDYLSSNHKPKTKGLLADTTPVLASNEYIIIETTIKHKEIELNKELESIQQDFNKEKNTAYKIIFIGEESWQEEKKKYIENLKNGYKYQIQDEPSQKTNPIENSNIESLATNIFDTNKIEIE